jgi:hypothetical protein
MQARRNAVYYLVHIWNHTGTKYKLRAKNMFSKNDIYQLFMHPSHVATILRQFGGKQFVLIKW